MLLDFVRALAGLESISRHCRVIILKMENIVPCVLLRVLNYSCVHSLACRKAPAAYQPTLNINFIDIPIITTEEKSLKPAI